MPDRVLIAGYYGRRNAGDEAILAGMLADLRQACPGAAFTVVSGDPDVTRQLHGVDVVSWADLAGLVEAVRRSSLVIVGGGGLFHDYWGVDPAAVLTERQAGIGQYAAPIVLAQMGKPSLLYAVGVGPLRTPEGRALTRDVFAAADAVTVRDAGSRAVLADVGCDAARVEIVPDPAFHLPRGDDVAVEGALRNLPRPVLGVALRPWAFGVDPEAWQGEVAAALDAHLRLRGGTALFVPLQDGEHEVEDDVAVSRAVMARMACGGRAALAPSQLDPLQRFRLLGRCDRVLAMRLHGVVAALRGGAPVVALAYDPKVEPLMDAAGLAAASLPPEAWRRERIVDALARGGESPRASPVAAGRGAEIVLDLLRRGPVPAPRREAAVRGLALEKVAEVLRLEREVVAQAAEIARLDRVNAAQAAELRKLEEGRARHSSKIEHLQRTADQLTAERNRLEFDYQSLNRSLGVNLVRHYWRALSSLAPEGSRRRAWYRIAHRSMRSALKLASRPLGLSRVVDLWGRIEGGSRTASGDLPADGVGGVVGASSHLAGFYSGRESSHLGVSKAVIFSATQLMENEGRRPAAGALLVSADVSVLDLGCRSYGG
ncbi:MAG: polysaccharide pyruvyl transferase family protein, partial [Anaerolineales bacterium]|nr:polysaccharide pyruvyl transferase family protein [Anaerolineales bacterium]